MKLPYKWEFILILNHKVLSKEIDGRNFKFDFEWLSDNLHKNSEIDVNKNYPVFFTLVLQKSPKCL